MLELVHSRVVSGTPGTPLLPFTASERCVHCPRAGSAKEVRQPAFSVAGRRVLLEVCPAEIIGRWSPGEHELASLDLSGPQVSASVVGMGAGAGREVFQWAPGCPWICSRKVRVAYCDAVMPVID